MHATVVRVLAVMQVLAVVTFSGCDSSGGESDPSGVAQEEWPLPKTPSPQGLSADELGRSFAAAMVTWDTRVDRAEPAAMDRALALAVAGLECSVKSDNTGNGRRFSSAKARKAVSSADIVDMSDDLKDYFEETREEIYRYYLVTWLWSSEGATWLDTRTRFLELALAKQGDGSWLVSQCAYEETVYGG